MVMECGKLRRWRAQWEAAMEFPPESGRWCARVSPDACWPWAWWPRVPGRRAQADTPTPAWTWPAGGKQSCVGPPVRGECHTWRKGA